MKSTTLSLTGTTGTIVDNRDGTHESSVINVTDNKGMTGQLSLLMPLDLRVDGAKREDQGLQPGEYSISISLTRKADEAKAARVTGASADASIGTATERRRGTTE